MGANAMKPSIKKSITAVNVILASGLLAGVSAYAEAGPDWSAYIGSGRANTLRETVTATRAPLAPVGLHAATPVWSAFIGTGQVSAASDRRREESHAPSNVALQPAAHWSAKIGTGHGTDAASQDVSRRAEHPARLPDAVAASEQIGATP
jgi:hypothetical protein